MSHGNNNGLAKLPILVIEDEPAVMAFIRAALERHGYSVVQANSGVEGLDILSKRNFRGIISDMRTPGSVNGADVHAWIAKHQPALISKILFTTGDLANEETARILKATGIPYIEKPFRVYQLIQIVESVLGRPAEALA